MDGQFGLHDSTVAEWQMANGTCPLTPDISCRKVETRCIVHFPACDHSASSSLLLQALFSSSYPLFLSLFLILSCSSMPSIIATIDFMSRLSCLRFSPAHIKVVLRIPAIFTKITLTSLMYYLPLSMAI